MRLRLRTVSLAFAAVVGCTVSTQAQRTPPRLQIVEDLRLDANAEDFSVLGPVKAGPRGDIALTFRQDGHIRIYDLAGKRVATVGRLGSGPGEFRNFQVEGWIGDTVWVYDHVLLRHTFIGRNGGVVRSAQLPSALVPTGGSPRVPGRLSSIYAPHAIRADGSMLGYANIWPSSGSQATGGSLAVVRASPAGDARVVGMVPAPDSRWDDAFAFRPQTAFSRDGNGFAQLKVDSMTRAGGTFTLSLFTANGDTVFVRTLPYAGEPIPNRVIDSALAPPRAARSAAERHDLALRTPITRERIPPVYTPVDGLGMGQDGTIWVVLRGTPEGQTAVLFDGEGEAINSVLLPAHSRLMEISASHIWVRETDADGLASLVRYRLGGPVCSPPECRDR